MLEAVDFFSTLEPEKHFRVTELILDPVKVGKGHNNESMGPTHSYVVFSSYRDFKYHSQRFLLLPDNSGFTPHFSITFSSYFCKFPFSGKKFLSFFMGIPQRAQFITSAEYSCT